MKYDRIFILAAQMERRGERYDFLEEDRNGFLHGEIRVAAAKLLIEKGMVKEVIVVGGPTLDGRSKVELIAALLPTTVPIVKLETQPNTLSNVEKIKEYLAEEGEEGEKNGLLTSFYHLPRALRMISANGYKLIPIAAEAILLADDPCWEGKIREWYSEESMLTRIVSEIRGLSAIEMARFE